MKRSVTRMHEGSPLGFLALVLVLSAHAGESGPARTLEVFKDVCPFEGCAYGQWKVLGKVSVHSQPDRNSEIIASVVPGTPILAKTGNLYIYPGLAKVIGPIPPEGKGIDPTQLLLVYGVSTEAGDIRVSQQENTFTVEAEIRKDRCLNPEPWYKKRFCWLEIVEEARRDWWAYIEVDGSDIAGWVLVDKNIEAIDKFS